MHFSDITLLFEQWIIFKRLQFILLFLNIWILTFYCFKTRFYLFLGFRVSNHWWAFQSLFSLSNLPSNHSTVAIQLYAIINIFDSWYQQEKNIQDTIQVFQIWHNLCSERTSIPYMSTFKMYSRNTKTTNEPTASNNKSDRPQVKIWDTWKTLKYLNIYSSFHLKDLEISKYKRDSKGRWPIQICHFIFVNCCFIWLSKH
jgi:hypothetical protein